MSTTTLPTAAERRSMSFMQIRAMLPAGEMLSEWHQDGTLVLRRPDWTVGEVPDAHYIVWPGNAVAMRKLAPSLADRKEGAA